MNFHLFMDYLTVQLSALLTRKNKFFSRGIESPTFSEHLQGIDLQLPEIAEEGQYEVKAKTLIGDLDAAFRIAQWKGKEYPTIIYHHGSGENPYDRSFNSIFLLKKMDIPANLIVIRAPFNRSAKEYMTSIKELANFVAMLSVSVKLIEQLISFSREKGTSLIVVSGISLGGWVTNLHRTFYNTADAYIPLLAGAALDDVFLSSIYRKLTGKPALENPEVIQKILNFEQEFKKVKENNVFPLLAFYDGFIRFEQQKRCYEAQFVNIIEKGHVTAALAPALLREHIFGALEIEKQQQ